MRSSYIDWLRRLAAPVLLAGAMFLLPAAARAEVVYRDDQTVVSVEDQTGREEQDAVRVCRYSETDFDGLTGSGLDAAASDGTEDTSAASSGMWIYGDHLTGEAKILYDAAAASMKAGGKVQVTRKIPSGSDGYDIYDSYTSCFVSALFAFKCDYPERMDWSCDTLGATLDEITGTSVTMSFWYDGSAYYTKTLHQRMLTEADRLAEKVKSAKSTQLGRLQYLHDWLVKNNTYDYDSSVDEDYSEQRYYSHSPYGCLFMGRGVCASYTLAYKLVCDRLGIPCIFVRGDGHSWNYVLRNDGKWYMVDCTWDDDDASVVDRTYFLTGNRPFLYGHCEDDLMPRPKTVWQVATPPLPKVSNTTGGVKITYTGEATGLTFRIYRKESGGSWKKLADTDKTSYVDKTVQSGRLYSYSMALTEPWGERVSSYSSSGKSIRYLSPVTSSDLTLTNWKSGMMVRWKKVDGCDGYGIYRRTASGTYSRIGQAEGADTLSWLDTGAGNGRLYYYSVRAYKGSTLGSYSGRKTIRLETPVLRSAESTEKGTLVTRWYANDKAASYQLQIADDSGFTKNAVKVTMTSASTLRKTLTGLAAGRKVYVRVRAYAKDGTTKYYSGWSSGKQVVIHS